MKFRPCIDLHDGMVKQIVGSTLLDDGETSPETNFTADKPPAWFAQLYQKDHLTGGHVIKLGPGNDAAAKEALGAWPKGLQLGGGINIENAEEWLDAGAAQVIVTSWVFHSGRTDFDRLKSLAHAIGKDRLVLDLSCRKKGADYFVVTDRWQTFTQEKVTHELLDQLALFCCEFLVHGVDVEGKCQGIETDLAAFLGSWGRQPVTYAGGIASMADIELLDKVGQGNLDFTVGSALDIFGGSTLGYEELAGSYAGFTST